MRLPTDRERSASEAKSFDQQLSEIDTLYRTAPVGLAMHDRELRCVRINEKMAEINGVPVEAMVGRRVREFLPAELAEHEEPILRRVCDTGEAVLGVEVQGQTAAGIPSIWLVNYHPLRDREGAIAGVQVVVQDITERSRADSELRRSKAWLTRQKEAFQAAVNGAPLDSSLGILVKAAMEQTGGNARCGFFIADAEGKALHHVAGMPETYAKCVDGFPVSPESLACGLAVSTKQPVITPDVREEPRWKDWLWLSEQFAYRACWSFPVETSTGRIVGTFAMFHEERREPSALDMEWIAALTDTAGIIISRHQEAEERARAARDLEAADQQKDEFLAMLAHELRNPLASISNAGELLSRLVTSGPRTDILFALLKRQTKQLTRLVEDLLDISRIARGRVTLEEKPLEISTVIEQAVETVHPMLREKAHRFVVTAPRSPMYVRGDPPRLVQAISNVLHNAAKYTERGGEIYLKVVDLDGEIVIEIQDNGPGISSELPPHVFDLFVQSEQTLDRSQGGLGIGLSVVKHLIEMHHGSVAAASVGIGHGSTFTIRLPRIVQPEENAIDSAPKTSMQRCRIVVVDDNNDAADSLAMLLRFDGHEVHTVYGAVEALEAAKRVKPDVMFLDIGLPQMDGYEVARRLRGDGARGSMRLVALTGYGQQEDRVRSQEVGFDDHLVKPVSPQALENIFAALGQSEQ
jgi:PAS domain S-box-containing protein